jgi:ferredoxin
VTRISVDRAVCAGHGMCESLAPEIFELRDDLTVDVKAELVATAPLDLLNTMVANCPTQAIHLTS